MIPEQSPTERELEILKILWEKGEATVREVYEELRNHLSIVQNTVQAFLRTMEEKGFVKHRVMGRTFVYSPLIQRERTSRRLASRLLEQAFDGAMDQLVQSVLSLRPPTSGELSKLEAFIEEHKAGRKATAPKGKRKT
jgi:BlaI family transcriptional regulator, penicillinase repressor